MIDIDTPGSGRVYDQRLSPLRLGGLVYTSSGADKTERVINIQTQVELNVRSQIATDIHSKECENLS